ncbi:hypothetical protein ACFLV5_00970 [Chloroflexota bacterium]
MESIANFSIWIKQLSLEVAKQTVAVMELAVSFADGAQRQARSDQAVFLRIFESRVMKEVEDIRQMESAEQSRDNNITLFGKAPAAFIFNSLYTAATRHKDAFQAGVRRAGSVLSKTVFRSVRWSLVSGKRACLKISKSFQYHALLVSQTRLSQKLR